MTNRRHLAACNSGAGPRLCRRPAAALHSSAPRREPNARPLAQRPGVRWPSTARLARTAIIFNSNSPIPKPPRPHHSSFAIICINARISHELTGFHRISHVILTNRPVKPSPTIPIGVATACRHNVPQCRSPQFVILPSTSSVSLWPKICVSSVLRGRRSALWPKDLSN